MKENNNKISYYVKVVALLPLQAHYPVIPGFFLNINNF